MPYGQDDAVTNGGYGQDPEVQGDASQWGPGSEAINGAMFGMGPTVDEWIGHHAPTWLTHGNEPSAAQEEANQQAWEQQHPTLATGATIAGGSLPFLATGGAAGGLGLLGRAGAMAATGAIGNSLKPISEGQDPTGAAVEGGASGALGELGGTMLGKGLGYLGGKLAGAFAPSVNVPTSGALQAAKTAAYNASEQAGDIASPQGLQRLKGNLTQTMADYGYDKDLQPGGQGVIDRMGQWPDTTGTSPTDGVTLKGLDSFRQVVNRMREGGASGADLANRLVNHIDDFVSNPQPGDWITGNGPNGAADLEEGRRLATIGFKDEAFQSAMQKATDEANTAGSGGNVRNKLAQAAKNLKWRSDESWTPDEQAGLQGMINPQPGEQVLRVAGKLDPTAHGLAALSEGMGGMLAGEHLGAHALWAIPAIGGSMVARRLSDAMMKQSSRQAGDTILNGGVNPYVQSAAQNTIQRLTPPVSSGLSGLMAATPQAALLSQGGQ